MPPQKSEPISSAFSKQSTQPCRPFTAFSGGGGRVVGGYGEHIDLAEGVVGGIERIHPVEQRLHLAAHVVITSTLLMAFPHSLRFINRLPSGKLIKLFVGAVVIANAFVQPGYPRHFFFGEREIENI